MKGNNLASRIEAIRARVKNTANSLADRYSMLGTGRLLISEFKKKRLSSESIHFNFHTFIAVFPLVLIITAVIGFVFTASPGMRANINDVIYEMFPDFDVAFKGLLDLMDSWHYIALLIGIALFLYEGVKAAGVLQDGFDRIWGVVEKRPFKRRVTVALAVAVVFGTLTVSEGIINFATPAMVPWVQRQVGTGVSVGIFFSEMVLGTSLGFLMFVLIYRLVPADKQPTMAIIKGSALALVLISVAEYLFGFYFNLVYDAKFLYGAMGVILGIFLWLYMVGAIIFFGALATRHFAGGFKQSSPDLS